MEYRIEYSEAAALEMEQAYLWVDRHNHQGALAWYEGLRSTVESLDFMPYRFAEMPKFGKGVRRIPYRQYLVLYLVVEPQDEETTGIVRILHIVHGAREITNP